MIFLQNQAPPLQQKTIKYDYMKPALQVINQTIFIPFTFQIYKRLCVKVKQTVSVLPAHA